MGQPKYFHGLSKSEKTAELNFVAGLQSFSQNFVAKSRRQKFAAHRKEVWMGNVVGKTDIATNNVWTEAFGKSFVNA